MSAPRSTLASECQENASTWINGNRRDAIEACSQKRWSHRRNLALAVGTMRVLANQFGDDAAADFATTITKPFGGHL